jgi:RNA polymerase sigma factor (sigma-70 family)
MDDTRDLIDRCCRRDALAWDEFVLRYNRYISLHVVRSCRFIVAPNAHRREQIRDLMQDVYSRLLADDCRVLRAWRGETEESLRSYLARITRATACDAFRRESAKKRSAHLVSLDAKDADDDLALADRLAAPESSSPDRILAERLAPQRLDEFLDAIRGEPNGPRDALIFQLHVLNGLTANEIAKTSSFGLQTSAVESVLRRTRERLKVLIGDPDRLTG